MTIMPSRARHILFSWETTNALYKLLTCRKQWLLNATTLLRPSGYLKFEQSNNSFADRGNVFRKKKDFNSSEYLE